MIPQSEEIFSDSEIIIKGLHFQVFYNGRDSKQVYGIPELLKELKCSSHSSSLILINGTPGIGKTLFCKSLGCNWAKQSMLSSQTLVFVVDLHNPEVQKTSQLHELIQHYYGDKAYEGVSKNCTKFLVNTSGKNTIFIFDGLDVISEDLPVYTLIKRLINKSILKSCKIIITSRPMASITQKLLYEEATGIFIMVKIMGITNQSRCNYFKKVLKVTDWMII